MILANSNLYIVKIVTEDELQKLYKNFSKLDKDKSGTLEPEEFFDIPGKFIFLYTLYLLMLILF